MFFSNLFAVILMFGTFLSEGKVHSSNMYHRIDVRSHGCGRAPPLYEILIGSTADSNITPKQVIEFLEQDESANKEVIKMMKQYDDCVRTADGIPHRKSQGSELSEAYSALYKRVSEALEQK